MAKRIFDFVVSAILIVALSPLLLLVWILVRTRLGSPAIFRQLRSGKDGKPFVLVKFRTMTEDRDAAGNLLPDEARLTALGKMLRRTSIDELPELVNVLRGEMSLVGPRPLLPQYDRIYSAHQARRLEVLPGVTGWAQVNGRNELSWDLRFDADVWYVDNRSFLLDLRILWRTLSAVLRRDGISAAGEATMPPFTGTEG
jgi:lipopolysaccharide/colanic/teichoic acid biosynthesis glycosyltransferase